MTHYDRKVSFSKEDKGWIAIAPELYGCSAFGGSAEEALQGLEVAIKGWLAVARKHKEAVPMPIAEKELQGRVLLRLPKALHHQLLLEAAEQGVSLNQYILFCLASRESHGKSADARARGFIDARGRTYIPIGPGQRPKHSIVAEPKQKRR